MKTLSVFAVALHPEGVDRNTQQEINEAEDNMSPSTRRAWIEISAATGGGVVGIVALHPEGVDRNTKKT